MKKEKTFFEILSLCLRSICPVCAQGHLFSPILKVSRFRELFLPLRKCDHCGFAFSREPGYFFGVLTPTLPILSLGAGIAFAAMAYGFFRSLDAALYAGAAGLLIGFFGFFRTAIAIYIAFDHSIDPPAQ